MKKMTVFGSSSVKEDSEDYQEIVEIGKVLGKNKFSVVSGGYGGSMKAISKGANQENADTIGITCSSLEQLFPEKKLNEFITNEIKTKTINERIEKLIELADAFTILPGSSGTQLEWITAYEKMNSRFIIEKPIIFYKADVRVKNFIQYLCEQSRNKKHLFYFAEDIKEYEGIANNLKLI